MSETTPVVAPQIPISARPAAAEAVAAPAPIPVPVLPDPVQQINESEAALQTLAAQEKRLREELATKDPIEQTADTINYAQQLLNVVLAIDKIKQERDAAIRRLARGI